MFQQFCSQLPRSLTFRSSLHYPKAGDPRGLKMCPPDDAGNSQEMLTLAIRGFPAVRAWYPFSTGMICIRASYSCSCTPLIRTGTQCPSSAIIIFVHRPRSPLLHLRTSEISHDSAQTLYIFQPAHSIQANAQGNRKISILSVKTRRKDKSFLFFSICSAKNIIINHRRSRVCCFLPVKDGLFCFLAALKRVVVFSKHRQLFAHLIFVQLMSDIFCNLFFILSHRIYIISSTPKFPSFVFEF